MPRDVNKTIDIIFAGVDNVSQVIDDIGNNVNNFGSGLQDISQPFQDVTAAVLAIDAALIGLVATGVVVSADLESQNRRLQNALGLPAAEAERFGEIAERVYTTGFAEDLAGAFDAVRSAQQRFSDATEGDLERIVTSALRLEEIFGVGYNESLAAARTLTQNFGITSQQAFDFIASGYQRGLDGAGDFLESINEFSVQFSQGGADAGQFFSVLETGFAEGFLGTDRAADAFKEFRIRIQDGSQTTADALNQIGLGQPFIDSLSRGETTAIQAFNTVIERLRATTDSSVQLQAGVGLIGTQFEDLGTDAALALNTAAVQLDDLSGSLTDLGEDEFGRRITAAFRSALTAVGNLPVFDELRNNIANIASDVGINLATVIAEIDTTAIEAQAGELFNIFADFFNQAELDLTTIEGAQNAIDIIVQSIESMINVTTGLSEIALPLLGTLIDTVNTFNELEPSSQQLLGNILAIGSAFGTLGTVFTVGGSLLSGISAIAGAFSGTGLLATGLSAIVALLTGPLGLAVALAGVTAAVTGFSYAQLEEENERIRASLRETTERINAIGEQVQALPATVSTIEVFALVEAGQLEQAQALVTELTAQAYETELVATAETDEFLAYIDALSNIPESRQTELLALINEGSVEEIEAFLAGIDGSEATVTVGANVDQDSLNNATETLEFFVEGERRTIEVPIEALGADRVTEEVNQLTAPKLLEIQVQGEIDQEIARIETNAETLQSAFQYRATVDTAQIEAQTARIQSAFDSVNASISSTGDVIASALGGAESSSFQVRQESLDILNQEQELREQSFALQERLTNAQIESLEARTDALRSGESVITIESTGLEPALELIMFEIIQRVQVRANENASEFLLGL